MKSTTTFPHRSANVLFASLALSMAALLAGCEKTAPVNESVSQAAPQSAPVLVPPPEHMQAWRMNRDGHQWTITSFDVQDLKCRNLTAEELAKTELMIPGGKPPNEFFEVIVSCDYILRMDREETVPPVGKETLKRQVTGENWYITRTDDASKRQWRGSHDLPGMPIS